MSCVSQDLFARNPRRASVRMLCSSRWSMRCASLLLNKWRWMIPVGYSMLCFCLPSLKGGQHGPLSGLSALVHSRDLTGTQAPGLEQFLQAAASKADPESCLVQRPCLVWDLSAVSRHRLVWWWYPPCWQMDWDLYPGCWLCLPLWIHLHKLSVQDIGFHINLAVNNTVYVS